jgi:uncharacterized protein (UPF0332 family)
MSFDWNLYLQLAKQLRAAADEASQRSAVSRAYYSAFHFASASIKANNIGTDPKYDRDRHLRIWKAYIDSKKKDCQRIGNRGQRLKLERQKADYDAELSFTDVWVGKCISDADTLIKEIGIHVPESFSGTRASSTAYKVFSTIKKCLGY